MLLSELRSKVIRVTINEESIIIENFGGLMPGKKYLFSEIDGFKVSFVLYTYHPYEFLYLMKGGKKNRKVVEMVP